MSIIDVDPERFFVHRFFFFWQCLCRLDWVSFTSSCVSVSRRSVICLRGRVDLQQHNKNQIGYLFSVALAEQGAPPPTISPYRAISAGRGRLTHTHNVNLAPVVLVRLYCFSGRPTCWPVASGSCTVKQTDPYLLLQGWKTRTWVSSDSRCVCVCVGGGGGLGIKYYWIQFVIELQLTVTITDMWSVVKQTTTC